MGDKDLKYDIAFMRYLTYTTLCTVGNTKIIMGYIEIRFSKSPAYLHEYLRVDPRQLSYQRRTVIKSEVIRSIQGTGNKYYAAGIVEVDAMLFKCKHTNDENDEKQ